MITFALLYFGFMLLSIYVLVRGAYEVYGPGGSYKLYRKVAITLGVIWPVTAIIILLCLPVHLAERP